MVNARLSCSVDYTSLPIVPTHQWSRNTVRRAKCKSFTSPMRGDWECEDDPPMEFIGIGMEVHRTLDILLLTEFFPLYKIGIFRGS
ncbi:hypothetical protein TNCV_4921901 [Trichonephila clavipes]|nr:hypothetical protein TNCV_4921901 [Trichonephila clavipes]